MPIPQPDQEINNLGPMPALPTPSCFPDLQIHQSHECSPIHSRETAFRDYTINGWERLGLTPEHNGCLS